MNFSKNNHEHIKAYRYSVSKIYKYLALFIISLLFGCASTSSLLSDFDESVDFNTYSTFVLCLDDLFVENTNYPNYDNNNVRQLIGEEMINQMKNKGHITNVPKPQLQVGFQLIVQEKETTFRNCEQDKEYGYWKECTLETIVYTEETLVLYVSDINMNQVIWQASITCDLNRSKRKLQAYVNELVVKLFNEYPKV